MIVHFTCTERPKGAAESARRFMNQHGRSVIRGPAPRVRGAHSIHATAPFRERAITIMKRIEKAKIANSIQRHGGGK